MYSQLVAGVYWQAGCLAKCGHGYCNTVSTQGVCWAFMADRVIGQCFFPAISRGLMTRVLVVELEEGVRKREHCFPPTWILYEVSARVAFLIIVFALK